MSARGIVTAHFQQLYLRRSVPEVAMMVELIQARLDDTKDKLVTAAPEAFAHMQGAAQELQWLLKGLTKAPSTTPEPMKALQP